MNILKKWVLNNLVAFGSALPNFFITLSTVTAFAVVLHWSGLFSTLAYLIAQGFSLQYSVWFNRKTRTRLTAFGRTFEYHERPKEG